MMVDPGTAYRERITAARNEEHRLTSHSRAFSTLRIAEFAAFVVVLSMGLGGELRPHGLWIGLCLMLIGAFTATAFLHERVANRLEIAAGRRRINEEGLARIGRRWDELPLVTPPAGFGERSVVKDLNLSGKTSLLQLAGTAETPMGRERLCAWLTDPPEVRSARARQEAVKELAGLLDLRQELQRRARSAGMTQTDEDELRRWSVSVPWYRGRPGLRAIIWALSVLPAIGIAGSMLAEWPVALPLLAAIVNAGVTIFFRLRLHSSFAVSERGEAVAEHLQPVFAEAASQKFGSSLLKELSLRILGPEGPLSALRPLERILGAAGLRGTGPFYWVIESLTLWDFHVLSGLERWRLRHGPFVAAWLDDLGNLEALSALATLGFENPEWCLPELSEDGSGLLSARGLGHPLIPAAKRVVNDFELDARGSFVLLTGSNMSGKSTFLRTVGINVLLAQAGGPVCASSFRLTPVIVATSLQIEDSLADGVSYFLAELSRLKEIVDAATKLSETSGPAALFLLDEMLRGTNSEDRRALAEEVLTFLMARRAVGIVSTHDSALAKIPSLSGVRRDFHFQETIAHDEGTARMTFDYRLRPGVALTTNARQLAEAIGLVPRADR